MKLCVIGNSHAGMIVHAHRDQPVPGLELTFFAKQGRGPEGVRLRGTELRAARPELRRALARLGMPDRIDIADFDGFVIVAMTATVFGLAAMVSQHSVFGWPSVQSALAQGGAGAAEFPLVSQAALDAAMCAAIEGNLALAMVRKIRRVGNAPILIVPQPHPSETLLTDKTKLAGLRRLHWRRDGAAAAATVRRAHDRVFGALPGVRVLDQPEQTVAHGFLTRSEFTRDAGRLNVGGRQPDTDILHANAQYGALVLEQIGGATSKS